MRYFLELDKDEVEYVLNVVCLGAALTKMQVGAVVELSQLRRVLLAEAPGVDERVENKLRALGGKVLEAIT